MNTIMLKGQIDSDIWVNNSQYGQIASFMLSAYDAGKIKVTCFGCNNIEALKEAKQTNNDIIVCGKLRLESWERDGERQYRMSIIAESIEEIRRTLYFAGSRRQTNTQTNKPKLPDITKPGWENVKVGFKNTGNLTWGDLARGAILPNGKSGKAYLHSLANWKGNEGIARVAQAALKLYTIPQQDATADFPFMDGLPDECPF